LSIFTWLSLYTMECNRWARYLWYDAQ